MTAAFRWMVALGMVVLSSTACSKPSGVQVRGPDKWRSVAQGDLSDIETLRFKEGICSRPLKPERSLLGEKDVVNFLRAQGVQVEIERPRADLSYVVVTGQNIVKPVRLRVALLQNSDEAGVELHRALRELGSGAWGVHRNNIAILGPASGFDHSMVFATQTQLACWGVFTVADADEAFVVPGAYLEI